MSSKIENSLNCSPKRDLLLTADGINQLATESIANNQRNHCLTQTIDVFNGTDLEKELLLSQERLDRASPDLWPEQIPGVTEFLANSSPPLFDTNSTSAEWLTDLDPDDINMLHGFGSLTASALLEKVKELQNLSYQLGLEEAREMTRGKFLNVLQTRPKRYKR